MTWQALYILAHGRGTAECINACRVCSELYFSYVYVLSTIVMYVCMVCCNVLCHVTGSCDLLAESILNIVERSLSHLGLKSRVILR